MVLLSSRGDGVHEGGGALREVRASILVDFLDGNAMKIMSDTEVLYLSTFQEQFRPI